MTKNLLLKRKGLGEKSALLLSTLAERGKSIFTVDDAVLILKEKKSSATKLLHDLAIKNWVFRVAKGKYLLLPLEAGPKPEFTEHEFVIASALVSPSYISYWSALNYYGLTEQVSKTVFVAVTKRKQELQIKGLTFKFVTIDKRKFFGFKKTTINGAHVTIAEKEKAIIDCLDLPRYAGGISEVSKAINSAKEELEFDTLIAYSKRMPNGSISNRLGYILEALGIEKKITPSAHYVLLDPLHKKKGPYNKKWRIIENISKEELLSE